MKTTKTSIEKLNDLYRNAGYKGVIENGPVGFVVYSHSRDAAMAIVGSLASGLTAVGVHNFETFVHNPDADEPEATRHIITLRFDWNDLPRSMTACLKALSP